MPFMATIDTINRSAWRTKDALRDFTSRTGWTDPGERSAIDHVRAEAAGRPILDIGVGTGRTTDGLEGRLRVA